MDTRRNYKICMVKGATAHNCICEKIRLIVDLVWDLPDKNLRDRLVEELLDAFIMGKRMNERLHYYKETYEDNTGGKKLEKLYGYYKRSRMRKVRNVDE